MRDINDNAVQGRLSENYLTRKIIAWKFNILDTKYSRFMVILNFTDELFVVVSDSRLADT